MWFNSPGVDVWLKPFHWRNHFYKENINNLQASNLHAENNPNLVEIYKNKKLLYQEFLPQDYFSTLSASWTLRHQRPLWLV